MPRLPERGSECNGDFSPIEWCLVVRIASKKILLPSGVSLLSLSSFRDAAKTAHRCNVDAKEDRLYRQIAASTLTPLC